MYFFSQPILDMFKPEHPSHEDFRNQHFIGFLHKKFGKVTPKIRCAMFNRLKRTFIM